MPRQTRPDLRAERMGNEGDLWDDSALINAFDDAISKYKVMHSKGYLNSPTEEEKNLCSVGENVSAHVDESQEAQRHVVADDNRNAASKITTDVRETNYLSLSEENHLYAAEHNIGSSNGVLSQNAVNHYSNSQDVEDYNHLLNQYYEVEEQRQKILQRLHQLGGWNHHCSGEGSSSAPWGEYSTSHEHQVPSAQASHPSVACSCCSCACQCLLTPCASVPACSLGGTCIGKTFSNTTTARVPESLPVLKDIDVTETAMEAAERAISTMRMNTSGNSNVNEGREKLEEISRGKMEHSTSSETDLSVVLNAWYSAGFYTGKYLMEQSADKKGHD